MNILKIIQVSCTHRLKVVPISFNDVPEWLKIVHLIKKVHEMLIIFR